MGEVCDKPPFVFLVLLWYDPKPVDVNSGGRFRKEWAKDITLLHFLFQVFLYDMWVFCFADVNTLASSNPILNPYSFPSKTYPTYSLSGCLASFCRHIGRISGVLTAASQ